MNPRDRAGFALPSAIITLVLLSALIAGAMFVATEELRAGRSDVANQRALAAAEWALDRAILNWDPRHNTRRTVGESVSIAASTTGSTDSFDVIATRVQRDAFWLTARGSSGIDGGRIPARHTIAASLRLHGPAFPLTAALTAGAAVMVDGGVVDGRDGTGSSELACRDDAPADVAGIVTPDTTLVCGASCVGAVPAGVFGNPPVGSAPALTSDPAALYFGGETRAALGQRAPIVATAGTHTPRPSVANGDCDRGDAENWGDPGGRSLCADYFPLIRSSGDIVLGPGSVGQGVLLVDGSVRLESGARFVGVVIAGNDIEVSGPGAVIEGAAFAIDADRVDGSRVVGGGAVTFNRCAVRRVELGIARLVRTRERWWVELR
jgi:hypothetical protein